MQISKINSNSFSNKTNNTINFNSREKYQKFDDLDETDFNLNSQNNKDNIMSPLSFLVTTLGLSVASYFATRKASYLTIKSLDGKFPLFGILDRMGAKLNAKLDKVKAKYPKIEVKDMKTFIKNSVHTITEKISNFGKKGLSKEEIEAFKKAHKTDNIAPLEAKNAIRKIFASIFGVSATGVTACKMTEDKDGNGIADKAEKKRNSTTDILKTIPAIAAATAEIV